MGAGGAERVVSILLPELVRRYEVTLILMNETLFHPVPEEVEIVWLERSRPDESGILKLLKLPWLALRLKKLCQKGHIDILVSLMNRPNYIAALARMMGLKTLLILGERGTPSRQYAGNGFQARTNRWLIGRLYPRADRVTTNSYGALADLRDRFSVPADKLLVIYNPFDLESIETRCIPLDRDDESFIFVTVGRLDEGKNHQMLIEAFGSIYRETMELWIVGDGPLRKKLEALATQTAGSGAIRFFDKCDPFPLLSRADAFVFASRREGLPNVLIEALACGMPVISTDCLSGPQEILAEETTYDAFTRGYRIVKYGVLVEVDNIAAMANAMKEVYNNVSLQKQLANHAKIRAQDFNKAHSVKQFIELIEGTKSEI